MSLDALAAAYAEVGRFDDAVRTVSEALAAANSQGRQSDIPELEHRLALYQARQKFRQSP
jgi:hypothetical protein